MSSDVGLILLQRFRLVHVLRETLDAVIYLAFDLDEHDLLVVKASSFRIERPRLLNEAVCYRALRASCPTTFEVDKKFVTYNDIQYLIMPYLGVSVQKLLAMCSNSFTLKTTLMVLDQVIDILEQVHKSRYAFRQLALRHLCVKGSKIHLIDFSGCALYDTDDKSNQRRMTVTIKNSDDTIVYNKRGSTRYNPSKGVADDFKTLMTIALQMEGYGMENFDGITREQLAKTAFGGFYHTIRTIVDGLVADSTYSPKRYTLLREELLALFNANDYTYDLLFDWVLLGIDTTETLNVGLNRD